ncbi:Putative oxidoreductase MhqP [Rubrobacter xylanophilus DSM 9941]|uniref:DoxX family protein n=1 Tax=Rubrobacter xylanophilus TaxID=49319 RepID=UPI001C644C2E|nr:DoxX family protein [Rubrobacter xylanophilus]QYJ17111.1 Putative oxidoreductase MhqP [Rubrobacter xylanophilus DSM 9941]
MVDLALLVLRLVLGVIFVAHGAQKLFGSFGGPGLKGTAGFFEQLGIRPSYPMAVVVGAVEFFGGILAALGFLTPVAAVGLILVMLGAILTVHLRNGFFNQNGGYEFNLTLIGVALALLLAGAGSYSLDAAFGLFW